MKQEAEISRFGVEEFMAQGVIVLKYQFEKAGRRTLQVRKMRGIKHNMMEMPFVMSEKGLQVFPNEQIYDI